MPPKVKITKEDIIDAATEIVRENGAEAINARELANLLKCSTQPVFSNFSNMSELRQEVIKNANTMCNEYIKTEVEKGEYPPYKASGMAYIRFAKEEKELFKLLYMRNRSDDIMAEEEKLSDQMESIIKDTTGLDGEKMELFHLEMWAFVHGIATMFATGFLDLPWELVSKMLTDSYKGLKKQYELE
ncbi:MAG: TetR/AcrR family transcriptional regulator [Ruminococcaceae bacterium]|nr:TetR/AcrR family transcriptional regulator [Oscillospiraceae bacterium]